ncbi:BMP family lipoprotein [Tannockella kyphosi]|uniref:BMP family lipoprotein n=1 Tax=Tannockella kyphosi TaxID=2899121 RepID=UPI002012821B|nr:BMP family ABC transporter substrate-binding protein [Tannockella kyphosi]
MKKLLALFLVFSVCLTGCSSSDSDTAAETYEIALVTDEGTITDESFNQSAWEAVVAFGDEYGVTYKYYEPLEFDTAGYTSSIEEAIDNGAKVIVCPGYKFADAVGQAQYDYPDVNFILIDSTPTLEGEECDIESNLYCVTYLEQQAGYLAGYAAVVEGFTEIGFMGGIALPAVVNFGYGYVQGAADAAEELGVTINMTYYYTGSFNASTDIKASASSWYASGVEIIFSCGGGICDSIFAAAEEVGAYTIGVDSDQSSSSDTVITSAMKGVVNTVYDTLILYSEGSFPSGYEILGAEGDYVGLSDDFSRFSVFTEDDYTALFENVKNGSIAIETYSDYSDYAGDPSMFATDSMTITYIAD